MFKLTVDLDDRSYPIIIGNTAFKSLSALVKAPKKIAIITDENVAHLYSKKLITIIKEAGKTALVYTFPSGEKSKNLSKFSDIITWLIENKFRRDDLILALGGGVTGDLAGFAAASYLRGIPWGQIPTTLLAQVDSSVGGKTGVNHFLGKNLIGAFYQPQFVLIDPTVLKTLSYRDINSGLAEALKYAFIADIDFLDFIEENLLDLLEHSDLNLMEKLIFHCCEIKASIVKQDELESGLRRILNFGHTLAHALETECGYGEFRHGEAVIYGMHWACWISFQKNYLDKEDFSRISSIFDKISIPHIPETLTASALVSAMNNDKKQNTNGLNLVLLKGLGKTIIESAENLLHFTEGWLKYGHFK